MSEPSRDQDQLLANFTEVTGVDAERSRFFLEASGWQLDNALASFFEAEHEEHEGAPGAPMNEDSDPEVDSTRQTSVISSLLSSISRQVPQSIARATGAPKRPPTLQPGQPTTLDSLRQQQESGGESSDDDDHQAFYAGGSESSGQQVLGPPRKKDEIVAEMFKKAREHGAEEVIGGGPSLARKKQSQKFGGTGYKLGETADDTVTLPAARSQAPAEDEPREVVLRMWSTGFTLNDGPLRDYHDVANMAFLNAVKRGEVPQELIRAANGQEVQFTMEDHRTEEYVPPTPVAQPFSGRGQMLGSPAPTTIGSTVAGSENDRKANESAAQSQIKLTDSEPTTNITFRLVDGTRVLARFNHSHTVNDLYQFVNTARPHLASTNYVLTFFPNNELTKKEETVKEANVLNAALIQKIK